MWGYLATEDPEFPGFFEFYQNVESASFLERTYASRYPPLPEYEVEIYIEDFNMYGIVYKDREYVDCVVGSTMEAILAGAQQTVRVEEVKHRLLKEGYNEYTP